MYSEGDVVRSVDFVDPTSGRLSQLFRKVRNLVVKSTTTLDLMLEDSVILTALLKVCHSKLLYPLFHHLVSISSFHLCCLGLSRFLFLYR